MNNAEILNRAAELLRGSVRLSSEKHDSGFRYWRDEMREIAVALEAMAAQPQQVPEGWQLVPIEPTPEMLTAVPWPATAKLDYQRMLAAARKEPK